MNFKKIAGLALLPLSLYAQQGIDIGKGFVTSGELKNAWVYYDYGSKDSNNLINRGKADSQGYYFSSKLSLETPKFYGLSAKVTGAGVTDFGINDSKKESVTYVFGESGKSFAILQELFLQYSTSSHSFIIGRNEIFTPMAEHDDYYVLANSFEVASYEYTPIKELVLGLGYFYSMSGNWDSGDNGEKFVSMSKASYVSDESKDAAGDSGVGFASLSYESTSHKIQAWNYYATHLYNTIFLQYNYTLNSSLGDYDFGIQYIRYDGIDRLKDINKKKYSDGLISNGERVDNIANKIYAIRADASYENGFGFNTSIAKFSDDYGSKETLGSWGGYPFFAGHTFEVGNLRNTYLYKLEGIYKFKNIGKNSLEAKLKYSYYDLDSKYSKTARGTGLKQEHINQYRLVLNYKYADSFYLKGDFRIYDIDNEPDVKGVRIIGGYRF